MLTTPVPRLVTRLAIPTVIMQLITLVYNTADTYFISQINASASASVSAVFAIMSLIHAVGFGISMGSSSLCSIRLGEEKNEEADVILSSAFFAAFVLGTVLLAVGLSMQGVILNLIGCSETMMPYARPYALIMFLAAPISCSSFCLTSSLRAEGQARLAMIGTVAGGLLNLVLDPVFIFSFGMGTAGAALATVLSQTVTFCIALSQFLRKKTIMHLKLCLISRRFAVYWKIITTGLPTIFRQGLASVATAALNKMAVPYGDAALAGVAISNKCYMLVRQVVLGIGQGFQPAAGYNFGAKEYGRTRKCFSFVCVAGSIVCCANAVVLAFFAEKILWWFCPDETVVAVGKTALLFACTVMPLMAFSTYVNQLYQCLGFRVQATVLASCRQGICFLPVVLILPRFIGVTGVQLAQPLADLLTCLISIPFAFFMLRRRLADRKSEDPVT